MILGLAVACVLSFGSAGALANPHTGFTPATKQCESCHQLHDAPSSNSLLMQQQQKQLCYFCHDGTQSIYNAQAEFGESTPGTSTMVSHHPIPENRIQCADCHTPHKGPLEGNPMSLSAGASQESTGNAVCGACHGAATTLPEGDKYSKFVGTAHDASMPVSASGGSTIKCLACHEPHGSTNTSLLAMSVRSIGNVTNTVSVTATSGPNPLCKACHDVADGTYDGGSVFSATRHSSVTTSTLASTVYPGSGSKAGDCENCHQPHGSGQPHMLRASGDNLCFGCHDATGTVKPTTYSYQGKTRYLASTHPTIRGGDVPHTDDLGPTSIGFAAWESTRSQTPSAPGTPMPADKIARLASMDASYAVTSLATATGQHDCQMYRIKSSASTTQVTELRLSWNGYGEEMAGYETSVSVWSRSANAGTGGWKRITNGVIGTPSSVATTLLDPSDFIDDNGYVWMLGDATKVIQSAIVSGPAISNVTTSQATVTWTTAGYADSWVDYGLTGAYGSVAGSSTRSINHTVVIPLVGLSRYHFRVRGTAREGDTASSADQVFLNALPSLTTVPSDSNFPGPHSISFAWTAPAAPAYGPFTYVLHVWDSGQAYSFTTTTTALTAATTLDAGNYSWTVQAIDKDGYYCPLSAVSSFYLQYYVDPGTSCPDLYAWDGTTYNYVTDVMGLGSLGLKVGNNAIRFPHPEEDSVIDPSLLTADGGVYKLVLRENRKEIDYIDRLSLKVIDHPAGTQVYQSDFAGAHATDNRPELPPNLPYTVSDVQPIKSASFTNIPLFKGPSITDQDITDAVAKEDGKFAPAYVFDDSRYVFDLGDLHNPSTIKLVMTGWTQYGTPAEKADWRATGALMPTQTVEVQNADGNWQPVMDVAPFIPGMKKTVVYDLSGKFPAGVTDYKVRMRGWVRTWVDFVGVDTSPQADIHTTELKPSRADLSFMGGGPRTIQGGYPRYLFEPSGVRYFHEGNFTRYGDVSPLLSGTDDKFVVMDNGDAVTLEFPEIAPPAPGYERAYVLSTDGYFKELAGGTVDPLPFHAMSTYPYTASESYPTDTDHASYVADYNTRAHTATGVVDAAVTVSAVSGASLSPLSAVAAAMQTVIARVASFLHIAAAPSATTATPAAASASAASNLHRSLNVDQVGIEVVYSAEGDSTGCDVCHATHGGGSASWDSTMPTGSLRSPTARLCTGDGTGGCHSNSYNSAGGVNVYSRLNASTNDSSHHDVLTGAQQRTGARIACSDCHDPHTENRAARYSDPDNIATSIATSLGAYTDSGGHTYMLVGAMHDGTPPTISAGPTITGSGSVSTILTPTVTWTTNESASTWIDFGLSSGNYTSTFGTGTVSLTHSVNATGLALNTLYYWRVRTADAVGNVRTSAEATYSTNPPSATFTAGPTLTGNAWANFLTPSVTWTTSDKFSTILEWGTSSGSYTASMSASALTTAHAGSMSSLATGTVYYWRARGIDAIGRSITSTETTYQASPPPLPLILTGPVISGSTWSDYTSPTVVWTTSDFTTSWLEYGTSSGNYTGSFGSNTQATAHSVRASNLTSGTPYYMKVFGFDPAGRLVMSNEFTYTPTAPTVPVITAGPTLSGGSYSLSSNPIVTWTTSDLTSSWVDWGTSSGSYTTSAGVGTQSTSHSVTLSGMSYGTTYYWRVRGVDPAGHTITSSQYTYSPTAYPTPVTMSESPNPAYYDSWFGPPYATVSVSCTPATIANGHAIQYLLYVDGSPYGTWQSGTSWSVAPLYGATHSVYVFARDATLTGNLTCSNTAFFDVIDTYSPGGSCPFLYTWDGTGYKFEADTLTAARIGGPTATSFQQPNPNDAYIIKTVPASQDGELQFKLVEERFEVDYLDSYRLFAIDAPANTQVYAEKAVAGSRTFPALSSALHTVKNLRAPLSAVRTDTGEDVLSAIASDDATTVALNESAETSFTYKTIELDLGSEVATAPQVKVVMNALSEFPVTAAGVARRWTFGAPAKLDVQGSDGTWRSVASTVGALPTPPEFVRPYVFDLTKALKGTTGKVRFTFLFRTLVDYVGVDLSKDQPIGISEVPMTSANLSYHGVDALSSTGDVRRYSYGDSIEAGQFYPGRYTRHGDVASLLAANDDKFVVAGQGDELDLKYAAPAAPAAGLKRQYVFSPFGYYKDMKTNVPKTVDPLPFAAMSNYPYGANESYPTDQDHQDYLSTYNTREESGSPSPSDLDTSTPVSMGSSSAETLLTGAASANAVALASLSPELRVAVAPSWLNRHVPSALASGSRVIRVAAARPIHYSVNTDLAQMSVEYFRDTVTTIAPAAGWYSSGATPTIAAPGTAASGATLADVASQNGQYWITNEATAEASYNWQMMRFDAPSSPDLLTARSSRLNWIGHGEPTANHPTTVYLWNFNASRWDQVATGAYGTDTSVGSFSDYTDGGSTCLKCHDGTLPSGVKAPSMKNISATWGNNTSSDFHGPRKGPSGFSGTALAFPYSFGQTNGVACEACHDPHGSANVYHIPTTVNNVLGISVTNSQSMSNLCAACHTGSAWEWHAACNDCHEGSDAQEGHGGFGWVGIDYNDCLACHGHGQVFNHVGNGGGCHGCAPGGSSWRTF